jgi:O-antigen/teichoic acid export membrane protein
MPSLFRRYLSAAGYTLGSAVVGRGIAFVNTVLLVRWLGPGNYGVYAVLLSLLMVTSSFANLRLDLGLARYLPHFLLRRGFSERELVKRAWWLGVALSLLTSMGLLAFAGVVATRVYARPELTGYVRLIAPAIALTVIQQMGLSTLAGLQDYRKVAMVQVLASVLQLVASVAGWAWMGLRGAVLGYVASTGIAALAAAFVARQRLGESGLAEMLTTPIFRRRDAEGTKAKIKALARSLGRCGKIDLHGLAHTFRCAFSGVLVRLADLKGLRHPSLTQLAFDNCGGLAPQGQQSVAHGVSRGNVDVEDNSSPVGAADSHPVLSPRPGFRGRSESFAQGCQAVKKSSLDWAGAHLQVCVFNSFADLKVCASRIFHSGSSRAATPRNHEKLFPRPLGGGGGESREAGEPGEGVFQGSFCRLGPHSTGPTGLGGSDATLARLTHFSVGCLFASLISTSGYWCGTAILTRYRGFEAAALFSVAYSFGAFTLFAPGYLLGPALPFLSEAWAAGRIDEFRELVRRNFRLAVSLTVPIAVFFAVVARPLVALVYGLRFASARPAASLLSLTGVFFLGVAVFNLAFAAAGRVWVSVALNSLWLALFAALSTASARAWGPAGVGLSFFLSLGVGYGVSCAYGVRKFGFSKVGAAPVAASVLAFGSIAVWLASRLTGVALWLAGCAVAVAVGITFLKAFYSGDELTLAWQTVSRLVLRWYGTRAENTSSAAL